MSEPVRDPARAVVSFVLGAELARSALAAMRDWRRGGDRAGLAHTLALARAHRLAWRRGRLMVPEVGRRDALARLLADEVALLALLAAAPTEVRSFCLAEAEQHGLRLRRLRALNAPVVVLDGTRRAIADALRGLDPASALADDRDSCWDDGGREPASLHVWLDEVLRCARGLEAEVDVSALSPGAAGDGDDPARRELAADLAEGHESTSLGMRPSRAFWLPAETTLPHLGDPGIASGLGGGPASFAFAGDALDAVLAPALRERVDALDADQALVAFIWVPNDVERGWDDLGG